MKQRRLFVLLVVGAILLSKPMSVFTQQYSLNEVALDLKNVSKDIGSALVFTSLIGLTWSDTYIGQLISIPSHWGVGFSMGATTLRLNNFNTILSKFGYTSDDSFAEKQLLPVYTIDLRIGGFGRAPFDLGIKFGYLPYMPLFGEVSYEASVAGLDLRWEIVDGYGNTPSVAFGLEVDSISGGVRSKGRTVLTGLPTFGDMTVGGDATAGIIWESFVFSLKLHTARSFWEPRLNIYAGLRTGAAVTKVGYHLIGGEGIIFNYGGIPTPLDKLSSGQLNTLSSELGYVSKNKTSFMVDGDNIIGLLDGFEFNLALYNGLAFDFNNRTYLDLSLMLDILNFELGVSISFRYQQ
jgi:hypothetical protein